MTRFIGYEDTSTLHTVATGDNPFSFKNSVWLVGYWEDFSVSYSASEANSNDLTHHTTHFGNPMNSEAKLNPYYRWSFPDRANVFSFKTITLPDTTTVDISKGNMGGLITSDIKRLHNMGAFEHISIDTMRLGKGVDYASILQHEYVDSNSNSNRYKYGGLSYETLVGSVNAGTYYPSYIMFNPSYSDAGRYYSHSGDTDITNGRSPIEAHSVHDQDPTATIASKAGNYSIPAGGVAHGEWPSRSYLMTSTTGNSGLTSPTPIEGHKRVMFNTMISTAGRFNYHSVRDSAYGASGVLAASHGVGAWARSGDGLPNVISADIKSPSGKPFLVVQQTFPSNHILEGQVFAAPMGTSFPTVGFGSLDGQWTTGDLTYSAPSATGTGTDYKEYTDLREGDIVVSPQGWSIVQSVYPDDKSISLYSLDASGLLNPNLFNPAHGSYLGAPAALNRAPISRKYWPVVNYDGPLNTASDGDVFHMRFCPQHLDRDGNANADRSLHYVLKVGYDKDQILWTERGNRYRQTGTPIMPNHFNACVEIDLELGTMQAAKANDPAHLGTYTGVPHRHEMFDWASAPTATKPQHSEAYIVFDDANGVSSPNFENTNNLWVDLDIVFDFTNQKYELYINGKRSAAGQKSMLPKPDGTLWVASDLHGWHIDAIAFAVTFSPDNFSFTAGQNFTHDEPSYVATLIDRVGVIRELSNPVNDIGGTGSNASVVPTKNTLITQMDMVLELDRTGMLNITVADDENSLHLQRIMKETTSDWKVMLLGDDIDDFIWFGDIGTIQVQQSAFEKSKEITINAEDSMNALDKIMPYWEVGQTAYGPSTTYTYRRREAEMATENFYFGTRRLLRSNQGLGLDHQTRTISKWDDATEVGAIAGNYSPLYEQRMRLYSAHPIQMYSGEESDGSLISMDIASWKTSPTVLDWRDNIWNMWSTRRIVGFSDGANHTWTGQTANELRRGIIAHCIEHNLRAGDTFEIGGYVSGSAYVNPFTYDSVADENKRTIIVKKIIDANSFVFVYPYTNDDFGPSADEKGSYWSVIRRYRGHGGIGPACATANHLSFWGYSNTTTNYVSDYEGLRDSTNWITQITTKNPFGAFVSDHDGKVQRIEIDGRLLSPSHTKQDVVGYPTLGAGVHGPVMTGAAFSTNYDKRYFILHWEFGKYFMNSPWSGINSAAAGVANHGSSTATLYQQAIDLASYHGGVIGSGWAKYATMNYKPAARVYIGAETHTHDEQFIDVGDVSPSFPAGSQYGVIAEDHHALLTVGPAWIFANDTADTGLQYLNKGTEEKSQVFTMVCVAPQYLWGGDNDNNGMARIYGYDTDHKNYRMSLLIRGNDIDQVDPKMPTTANPHSLHASMAGAGPATRYTDGLALKAPNAPSNSYIHGGGEFQKLRLANNTDSRWSTAGTIGNADYRTNIPVASINTSAVTSDPDLDPAWGGAVPDWDTRKLLIPPEGEIAIQSNQPANLAGGQCITYTYESFDTTTDTFINCRPLKTTHRTIDIAADQGSGVNYIRLCIPAVETHCQAVFIPPTNRQQKHRNRVSHAAWMQDIRNSLWFKMTFGRISKYGVGVDGPKRGALAIQGDLKSPHINSQLHPFADAGQHTDTFTLTADADAGATTIRLTPSCGIPMISDDGTDYRYKSSWGQNLSDMNTDPWLSIPSYSSNSSPTRKNGGLCFEIYSADGSLDVGIGDSAKMISCKDDRVATFKKWEIVSIREEEVIADNGLLLEYGVSDGTAVAGALWLRGAYDPVSWYSGAWVSTAPTQDPDMYHSGDPETAYTFEKLNIGDTIFLGNTRGGTSMPQTDDGNREWNPNNPHGQQRDLVSYRWYKIIDKTADNQQICIFPAQHAYHDREQFFFDYANNLRYPLKHPVAAHDGVYATPNAFGDSHSIPTIAGTNPHQALLPALFPTQEKKSCFMYCGDIEVSGVKFTQKRHLTGVTGRFRQIRDDYRHIYIMWADMRNDGSADADGGYRKDKFGLVYPTVDNYDISLVYATSQEDIIELKMGEDLDIWSMDSTDPYTAGRWSDNRTNTITGDYDFANILHNWEDKAGAFLIIDSSKFFNLNTYANNGRIGLSAGGEKDLDGITVQSEGFPELMDNYWWWAMPHPYTAKYRLPYDPTWRFVVRYATKVASDIDNNKPIINLDSSPYYQGSYFDELSIKGSYEFIQYSNDAEAQDAGNQASEWPVGGTWSNAMGCFVTDYDEMASTAAKRLYLGTSSRVIGAEETLSFSHANDQPYVNTGMNTLRSINDHTIFSNWAATHALPLMMSLEGHIETPSANTYWEHDKIRLIWQKANQKTWLSGSRIPMSYDISEVPLAKEFDTTHQGTTDSGLIDSYGSTYDGRGQTVRRIVSSIQQSSGAGYTNSLAKKWHFSIERGRFTYRPSYSSFLTLNRDNLIKSNLRTRASKSADHIRVIYNGGSSFVDYPKGSLDDDAQSSKWKLIDASNISSASEAFDLAVQNYEAAKKGSFKVSGSMIRESGQTDLMSGGRHGYVATPCIRSLPSSSTNAVGTSTLHQNSITAGSLFSGRVNALDGNLDGLLYLNRVATQGVGNAVSAFGDEWDELYVGHEGDSEYYLEGRGNHGSGTCDTFSVTSAPLGTSRPTVPAHQSYGWYGIGSIDKALQVVSVTKDMPLVSASTGNDLRMFITHNSDVANEGKYIIWLFDISMLDPSLGTGGTDFSSITYALNTKQKEVEANGYVELEVPTSYGADPTARITVSFNKDYCDSLLKYRSHSATSSKSNKGNRVDHAFATQHLSDYAVGTHGFNKNSTVNEGSAFPLGLIEFADGDDVRERGGFWWLHKARAIEYAPSIIITKDIVWRPGRTVNYVDSHLDLNEELLISQVKYSMQGQEHEQVMLDLKRDDAQVVSSRGFLLPNLGSSYKNRPEPPAPPAGGGEQGGDEGGSPSGGGGGGGGLPHIPPQEFPPSNSGPPSIPTHMRGNMIYSPTANISYQMGESGRGLAIGVEAKVASPMGSEGTHDTGATGGSQYGTRSQTGVGAPPQDGGYGAGATSSSDRIGINKITKGAWNQIKGKGDLSGEAGIVGQSGLLGVNKNKSTYMHTTENNEMSAVVTSKTVSSGNANITSSGFSLPGRSSFVDGVPMSTFDYHEFTMTLSTPKGTTGKKMTIKAKVNAPATTGLSLTATYSVYTTVTCIETGVSIEHQANFTGLGSTNEIILMPTKTLEGMQTEGNTIEIKVGRAPGSTSMDTTLSAGVMIEDDNFGDDNAQFEAIEIKDIKIYTEKKKKAPSFKQTATNRLRMKDNTVGLFSGTNNTFQLEKATEGSVAGEADRTNEGSGQSSGRKVDGTFGEGDDDPYSSIIT